MSRGPSHITHNLSDITKNIAKTSGVNAKISVQKLYAYWDDIIGQDFATKSIPYHISWGKPKKQKAGMFSSMPMMNSYALPPKKEDTEKSPLKKPKDPAAKNVATLHIAASSAVATKIMYQESLILERILRILGSDAIKSISVKHESGLDNKSIGYKLPRKLSADEKSYLDTALESIEDNTIKELLKSLGEKILLDKT